MKPTSLRQNDLVIFENSLGGTVLTFSKRIPSECGRPATCVFHTPFGELVTSSDHNVHQNCRLLRSSRLCGEAAKMKWIPCTQEMPDAEQTVLFFIPYPDCESDIVIGYFDGEENWYSQEDTYYPSSPTHWMDLSEIPLPMPSTAPFLPELSESEWGTMP